MEVFKSCSVWPHKYEHLNSGCIQYFVVVGMVGSQSCNTSHWWTFSIRTVKNCELIIHRTPEWKWVTDGGPDSQQWGHDGSVHTEQTGKRSIESITMWTEFIVTSSWSKSSTYQKISVCRELKELVFTPYFPFLLMVTPIRNLSQWPLERGKNTP